MPRHGSTCLSAPKRFASPAASTTAPDPAPHLAHRIIPLRGADQDAVDPRLLQQQAGDFPRRGQGRFILGLVQEGDQAGVRRHVLGPALRMRQHGRDHGGCDWITQRRAGQLGHELRAVDVLGVQGLSQHVQAHDRHDDGRAGGDHRLMRCGCFERQPARAVRLDDHGIHGRLGGDAVEQGRRHALHFVLLDDDLAGDDHMAIRIQDGRQFGQQRRFIFRDQARGRAQHLADEDPGGHGGDHPAAGRGQLIRQPEHQRGLAAAADEDDRRLWGGSVTRAKAASESPWEVREEPCQLILDL